jgi:hypothetical protein
MDSRITACKRSVSDRWRWACTVTRVGAWRLGLEGSDPGGDVRDCQAWC